MFHMQSFVDPTTLDPVPGPLVVLLAQVDRGRGREELHAHRSSAVLDQLAARAQIESVISSSAIENVTVPRPRAEAVLADRSDPQSRPEYELAGYRAALDDVFADVSAPITVARLIAWHRMLFAWAGPSVAGRLKQSENDVMDVLPDGRRVSRFRTASVAETPRMLTELVERYDAAGALGTSHPVVLVAAFVLDLLVIHPFEDGNGRVARIATNALLARAGYGVCRYVPLEQLVADHRARYYAALAASTDHWYEAEHTVWPWTEFLAAQLGEAYRRLDRDASAWTASDAATLVEQWLASEAPTTFSFGEASRALPSVSRAVIRSTLKRWQAVGKVQLGGAGRGARWQLLDRGR